MPLLGAHLSIAGGYYKAVESAAELGMGTVQIFTGSPQIWAVTAVPPRKAATAMRPDKRRAASRPATKSKSPLKWRSKPISDDEAQRFVRALDERQIVRPVAHSSYLINLASPNEALWRRSLEAMIVELERAARLELFGVVVHPGAATDASDEDAIANVVRALDEIHRRTPAAGPMVLLENTAGQGSCLGWRFEHLGAMIQSVREPQRLGVCFDTCHAFAAGYPLAKSAEFRRTMDEFDRLVGVSRIRAFHLNDSKRERGSRVDRHEQIGHGQVGIDAFRRILRDPRFAELPMYLETPKGMHGGQPWDQINLRTLRELATK